MKNKILLFKCICYVLKQSSIFLIDGVYVANGLYVCITLLIIYTFPSAFRNFSNTRKNSKLLNCMITGKVHKYHKRVICTSLLFFTIDFIKYLHFIIIVGSMIVRCTHGYNLSGSCSYYVR